MIRRPVILRLTVSVLVLLAVGLWLDPAVVINEVRGLSLPWLALGLAISVIQMMLCAWRWRLTAGLIGVPLRFRYALGEYYLAQFINQVLPGGVLGDAGRALRHAHQTPVAKGSAWRAVIIERASGQLAVSLLTALALVSSPLWHAALGASGYLLLAAILAVAVVLLWGSLRFTASLRRRWPGLFRWFGWVTPLGQDIQRGLLQRRVWGWQLATSLLVVFSYALVMLCAARAIGVALPASALLALAPALLLAMLVPLTVAGWGVREGTAASVWAWVGLAPSQGVAVSLAYGLVVFMATLPGLVIALKRRGQAAPNSSGGSGATQVQLEEGVIVERETSCRRAQRRVEGIDRCHLQAWPPGADQQRSDQQVQVINTACFNELGYRNATAFHEDASMAEMTKRINHRLWRELPVGIDRQFVAADMSRWSGQLHFATYQVQGWCTAITQQGQAGGHSATRVEYHPQGVVAADMPDGKAWIIRAGRSRANYYRITHGPQTVQMNQALLAIDVMRVPTFGGNPPIKALPKLGHHPRHRVRTRYPAVEQFTGVWRYRASTLPAVIRIDRQRVLGCGVRLAPRQQPLPRHIGRYSVARGDRHARIIFGHSASTQNKSPYHAVVPTPMQARPIP